MDLPEHAKDVWMPEVALDLDLAPELMLDLRLLQLRLEEDLQRHDVLGLLLPGQVNVAELALAERPADVKVLELPAVAHAALRVVRVGLHGRQKHVNPKLPQRKKYQDEQQKPNNAPQTSNGRTNQL